MMCVWMIIVKNIPENCMFYCFVQVLAYMHAQSTFFHQGFDLFDDLETYMKKVAAQVRFLFCHKHYYCIDEYNKKPQTRKYGLHTHLFDGFKL